MPLWYVPSEWRNIMEYITDSNEAAEIDRLSISEIGIPSLVLMERASMAVFSCIHDKFPDKRRERIAVVCGSGNNGGDGVCVARMLFEAGYKVTVLLLGNEEKWTDELRTQIRIIQNLSEKEKDSKKEFFSHIESNRTAKKAYDVTKVCNDKMGYRREIDIVTSGKIDFDEYTVIVDAIFGIGLKRDIEGIYAACIDEINKSGAYVLAVDIPSGINADNGHVMGKAVFADMTVTFGTNKRGNVLFPGCLHAGEVVTMDIGFPRQAVKAVAPKAFTYSYNDIYSLMPKRKPRSNKGSYGKVLVIAGSEGMSGACYFSAMAAYRMGCGLVKILSTQNNLSILKTQIPEALFGCYEDKEELKASIGWADVIVFGPGIGKDNISKTLFNNFFDCLSTIKMGEENKKHPKIVVDADGINLLADEDGWENLLDENFIITPHLKEMSRLTKLSVDDIKGDMAGISVSYSAPYTLVLKDAKTFVSGGGNSSIYINTSGNNALATGGSGDVLSGMIAGILAQGKNTREAAQLAVYLHGLTAESFTKRCNPYSMVASDILEELKNVLNFK